MRNHCAAWIDRNNPSQKPPNVGLPLRQACGCSVGGQLKPHYLGYPSPFYSPTTMSSQHQSSSPNLVGGHYRVGRKIGEGSFGVIFEGLFFLPFSPSFPPTRTRFFTTGTNLLNSQTVAIKFVGLHLLVPFTVLTQPPYRNLERPKPPS